MPINSSSPSSFKPTARATTTTFERVLNGKRMPRKFRNSTQCKRDDDEIIATERGTIPAKAMPLTQAVFSLLLSCTHKDTYADLAKIATCFLTRRLNERNRLPKSIHSIFFIVRLCRKMWSCFGMCAFVCVCL